MLQTQEDKRGSQLAECFHTLRISQVGQDGAVLGTVSDFCDWWSHALLPSMSTWLKFHIWKQPNVKSNWLKIGPTLGTMVFLWIYLIKQHNEDFFLSIKEMNWNNPWKYLI